MRIGKACAIFENIDSLDFTDLEKGEAIYEVLKMPTHNSMEVIGNIHDNPELLEDEFRDVWNECLGWSC